MKKLAALLLSLLMCVTLLAACGGTDSSTSSQSDSQTSASSDASTDDNGGDAVAGMDGWEAFGERVHITVPVYDRAKEGFPPVDDNYWTQYIQKEFGDKWNIDVEYVAIGRNQVMMDYNLLIVGDDTPTIMMEYDYPKVAEWAATGAMGELDLDAFAQVAPTFYQAMVDNDQLQYTDIDGKTFFALTERAYNETPYTFVNFVRMDWLREVGYDDVPKSYEEHVDAITKIMDAGLCGAYPMGLGLPHAAYVNNFGFRDFPVDEAEWAQHSSLGTPSLSWYPTYRLLKRQNAEYNAGWYSSEYDLDKDVSGGSNQLMTDFINGNTYQYGGYFSANMDWLISFYDNNPDAELAIASDWAVVEAGVADQPCIRADNPFGMIVGFSALATDDQLKAAWMLMEWMIQPENLFVLENGVEGVTYTLDDSGLPVVDGEYRGEEMLNHNMNIDMTCLVHAVKKTGTIEETIAAATPQGVPQDFYQMLVDSFYEKADIAKNGWSYTDPVFSVELDESEDSATLLSKYQEFSVQLVKCNPDEFDALYDKLSEEFLGAGYDKIIAARLAAYEDGSSTKLPAGAGK